MKRKMRSGTQQNVAVLVIVTLLLMLLALPGHAWDDGSNRIPTKCETCKLMAIELTEALRKLDSNEALDSRFRLDDDYQKRRTKQYKDSYEIEESFLSC
jgi:hypothetical protein